MNLCFPKCEKLSFFGAIFGQILVDVQKHYKIGISTLFKNQKNGKNIFKVNNWAKLGVQKKTQLGPIIDIEKLRALFIKKCAETPIFIGFLHNLF